MHEQQGVNGLDVDTNQTLLNERDSFSATNKIVAWIQTHKVQTACIIFAAFILPLIIVHILFKLTTDIDWFVAKWEAGDVLGPVHISRDMIK